MKLSLVRTALVGAALLVPISGSAFAAAEPAASAAAATAPATPMPAAAPAAPVASEATKDLEALVNRIRAKLGTGQPTAESLAPELKEFDALYLKHKSGPPEEAANILVMHAMLYVEVLNQNAPALALLKTLKQDLPNTEAGQNVDGMIQHIEREAAAQQAKQSVVGQPAPELNFLWSQPAGLTTLSALKGKVVVVDFWATWCGPCILTFPKIRELAAHYKDADVVILGVTSLQGRVTGLPGGQIDTRDNPAKEQELLAEFAKAKEMTWPIVVSKEAVFNEAYGVSGIPHVAIIGADGKVKHNGLHPADPLEEKIAKIDALLKEAGLKVP